MINICNKPFSLNISITEIYNIIHNFNSAFNYKLHGHNKCLCNQINKENIDYKYLQNFYQDMINITKIYKNFFLTFNNLKILLDHTISIYFNCDIELYKTFLIIAYNDEYVFNIYIKPNLSEMNYYEILNESLIDTFLILNCKGKNNNEEDNKKRFNNKKIKTLVFSLNLDDYFEIEWTENDIKKDIIIDVIKEYIYSNYNYYKNSKKLNDLIKDFKEINKELPYFISLFFDRIGDEIDEITKDKFNIILNSRIDMLINSIFI